MILSIHTLHFEKAQRTCDIAGAAVVHHECIAGIALYLHHDDVSRPGNAEVILNGSVLPPSIWSCRDVYDPIRLHLEDCAWD